MYAEFKADLHEPDRIEIVPCQQFEENAPFAREAQESSEHSQCAGQYPKKPNQGQDQNGTALRQKPLLLAGTGDDKLHSFVIEWHVADQQQEG